MIPSLEDLLTTQSRKRKARRWLRDYRDPLLAVLGWAIGMGGLYWLWVDVQSPSWYMQTFVVLGFVLIGVMLWSVISDIRE